MGPHSDGAAVRKRPDREMHSVRRPNMLQSMFLIDERSRATMLLHATEASIRQTSVPTVLTDSVDDFQDMLGLGGAVDPEQLCQQLGVPEALRARVLALAVVPPDTPLPMSMLAMLWRLGSLADAEATANLLEGQVRGTRD